MSTIQNSRRISINLDQELPSTQQMWLLLMCGQAQN